MARIGNLGVRRPGEDLLTPLAAEPKVLYKVAAHQTPDMS